MKKNISTVSFLVASLTTTTLFAADREPASYRPTYQDPAPSSAEMITNTDNVPDTKGEDYGITGNWGGYRSTLGEKGINFAAIYKVESSRVLSGGEERTSSYLQNLDLRLLIDADKLVGWKGARFFFSGLGNWARNPKPSETLGDTQGVTNIEAPRNVFKLYEAWFKQSLFDDKASLLVAMPLKIQMDFYI